MVHRKIDKYLKSLKIERQAKYNTEDGQKCETYLEELKQKSQERQIDRETDGICAEIKHICYACFSKC